MNDHAITVTVVTSDPPAQVCVPCISVAPTGWRCPSCSTVYSPLVTTCARCSPASAPAPFVQPHPWPVPLWPTDWPPQPITVTPIWIVDFNHLPRFS